MIEARDFVEPARERGFDWYAGVPCSYLTPFINYVLQDPTLEYLSVANEGDAVALIAGVALGGDSKRDYRRGITMMQNSGLGNAVSPLTSLTWTFQIPQLLVVTWRGQPGVADEPQHALMGPITPTLLDSMQIAWELFPTDATRVGPALDRAIDHMTATSKPYALLMQKNSVAPFPLREGSPPRRRQPVAAEHDGSSGGRRATRRQVLEAVIRSTPCADTVVFASTGFCGRELYAIEDRPNQFYMVGSMGCVLPLALGFALARPDFKVIALDGDGAALMRMGSFATVGAYGPANLRHLLLDNQVHDSTGGQATVSAGVDFAGIAAACGYCACLETTDLDRIESWLKAPALTGPSFVRAMIRAGASDNLPRPTVGPVEVKTRLMAHVQSRNTMVV